MLSLDKRRNEAMQDTQTLKAQIIYPLDFLPTDSLRLLAEFAVFLRAKTDNSMTGNTSAIELESMAEPRQKPIRIPGPRLVNGEQIKDFKMEVIEETSND
jgi:hypothetical protein